MNFVVVSLVSHKGVIAFGSWQAQGPKVLFWQEWTSAENSGLSSDVIAAWNSLEVKANLKLNQQSISEIFVVSGPGSFTGIRVGAAFAAGLAYGLNIPVYSLPTFELFDAPVGIPVRTHLAMSTNAADCSAANIEFMFLDAESKKVDCRLPVADELLLGVADASEALKHWPTASQVECALTASAKMRKPLSPDYGIGPKISGKRT